MIKRFSAVIGLIFLLLFAQQAALLHPFEHFNASPNQNASQNQQSSQKQPSNKSNKESPGSASFCEKCAAYAALGNALSTSHAAIVFLDSPTVVFHQHEHAFTTLHTRYYAARAPPPLSLA